MGVMSLPAEYENHKGQYLITSSQWVWSNRYISGRSRSAFAATNWLSTNLKL